jgi:5-methylcytosine-specific restriction enzyme subunit McrC
LQIPIQNIYYLLCYAWDKLEEGNIANHDIDANTDVLNLLAKIFVNGSKHLLKRGLEYSYRPQNQILAGVKGKLLLTQTLKKPILQNGQTICEFDEFTINTLPNQIIKTTLLNLQKTSGLDKKNLPEIRQILVRMSDIESVTLQKRHFREIALHRNNSFYDFTMKVAELIFENLLVNEETGSFKMQDFVKDERKMATLFEAFVRNFYKKELPNAKVTRENLTWLMTSSEENSQQFLPKMQTDISIFFKDRKVILETKFYKETLQKYYNSEKIHSENLYQLFAYLKNQKDYNTEGVLLYPTVQDSLSMTYTYENHKIKIQTINLNQDWQGIRKELLALVLS